MLEVNIKIADSSDANLIRVLGCTTFYEAYYQQDEPPNLANYITEAFSQKQILSELSDANSTFFVVYLNEKAVGYAKLRENSIVDCVTSRNAIELQRIYLLQAIARSGVGAKLLQHCLKIGKGKGYDTLWLSVWEENQPALRFYAKHGFEAIGKVSFPYGADVGTNFVLQKSL